MEPNSKNGPNHLFLCQYTCFKEWGRWFCDIETPLMYLLIIKVGYFHLTSEQSWFKMKKKAMYIKHMSCILANISFSQTIGMIMVLKQQPFFWKENLKGQIHCITCSPMKYFYCIRNRNMILLQALILQNWNRHIPVLSIYFVGLFWKNHLIICKVRHWHIWARSTDFTLTLCKV